MQVALEMPLVPVPMDDAEGWFPPQREVIDGGFLDLGFAAVLSMPTGSGKTRLAEVAIDRALTRGQIAIYISPLRAIAQERGAAWQARFPGRRVVAAHGDAADSERLPYPQADVLVMTCERFDGVIRQWQRHLPWLARCGVLVVDEVHLIADPQRGPRLEGAISRFQRVVPFAQVVALSGTMPNHGQIATWLGGASYHSTWRPVPLQHQVVRFKRSGDKDPAILSVVATRLREHPTEQILVFVGSRSRSVRLAQVIAEAGHPAAAHHAGLARARRNRIEQDFRRGVARVLVATPTVEMGVNLPCSTVIIADVNRWTGDHWQPMPVWRYIQQAGRAGRPGQDRAGTCVVLVPQHARDVPDYPRAAPEAIWSGLFRDAALFEQVLIEVTSRSCRTPGQLRASFLPTTLAYHQDAPRLAQSLDRVLATCQASQLLRSEEHAGDVILHATSLGVLTVRHQIAPATAASIMIYAESWRNQEPTDFDLLLDLCWLEEASPIMPLDVEAVDALVERLTDVPSWRCASPPPARAPGRRIAAGVRMAESLWRRIHPHASAGADGEGEGDGDLEQLAQSIARLARAAADLADATDPVADPEARRLRDALDGFGAAPRLRTLADRVEHGLDAMAAGLLVLDGLGPLMAVRLVAAGFVDCEAIAQADIAELERIPGIGALRSAAWCAQAAQVIASHQPVAGPAPCARRDGPRAPADPGVPAGIDPGRLARALTLTVTPAGLDLWEVCGGADRHVVTQTACDCGDAAAHGAGWWCKHRLALALHTGDAAIVVAARRLGDSTSGSLVDHMARLAVGSSY